MTRAILGRSSGTLASALDHRGHGDDLVGRQPDLRAWAWSSPMLSPTSSNLSTICCTSFCSSTSSPFEHLVGGREQQALEVGRRRRAGTSSARWPARCRARPGSSRGNVSRILAWMSLTHRPSGMTIVRVDRRQRALLRAGRRRCSIESLSVQPVVVAGLERPGVLELHVVLEDGRVGDDPLVSSRLRDLGGARPGRDRERDRLARAAGRVDLAQRPTSRRRPARDQHDDDDAGDGVDAPGAACCARAAGRRSRRRRRRRSSVEAGRLGPGRRVGSVASRSASSGVRGRCRAPGSFRGRADGWPSSQACSITAAATLSTTRRRASAFILRSIRLRSAVTVVRRSS